MVGGGLPTKYAFAQVLDGSTMMMIIIFVMSVMAMIMLMMSVMIMLMMMSAIAMMMLKWSLLCLITIDWLETNDQSHHKTCNTKNTI